MTKSAKEMMAGMLGSILPMSDIMTAAQQLASTGAVEKILKFAGEVEDVNARLVRIEFMLQQVLMRYDTSGTDTDIGWLFAFSGDQSDGQSGDGSVACESADDGYSADLRSISVTTQDKH